MVIKSSLWAGAGLFLSLGTAQANLPFCDGKTDCYVKALAEVVMNNADEVSRLPPPLESSYLKTIRIDGKFHTIRVEDKNNNGHADAEDTIEITQGAGNRQWIDFHLDGRVDRCYDPRVPGRICLGTLPELNERYKALVERAGEVLANLLNPR